MAKDCNERGSFNDEYDAKKECLRLQEKYDKKYSFYLCNICNKYHVRQTDFGTQERCGKCTGRYGEKKALYKTREEAEAALYENISGAIAYYYCKHCDGYHLTSHPRGIKGHRK